MRFLVLALVVIAATVFVAPLLGGGADVPDDAASAGAIHVIDGGGAPVRDPAGGGDTVIERDGGGQFHLSAEVDGQEVRFLVDTGADVVALTMADAGRLGISPDPASFAPILRTASGTGYGAPVRIDRLTIGGHDLSDVDAVVVRGLSVSLLGQSVLRQLGTVTLEGDRLVIAG